MKSLSTNRQFLGGYRRSLIDSRIVDAVDKTVRKRGQRVVDVQVVNPAMRQFVRSNNKDVQKLLGYARALGVERKIRSYLEALL